MPKIVCPECRNRFDTCSMCWGRGYVEADPPRTPFQPVNKTGRAYTDGEKLLLISGLQHLRARITLKLRESTNPDDFATVQSLIGELLGDKPKSLWTTEVPTVFGNYWYRQEEEEPQLCELTRYTEDEEQLLWVMGVEGFVKLSEFTKKRPLVQWQPVVKPL